MLERLGLPDELTDLIIQFMDIDSRIHCSVTPKKIRPSQPLEPSYQRWSDGMVVVGNYFIISTPEHTFCIHRVYDPVIGYNIHTLNRKMMSHPRLWLIDWTGFGV